MNNARHLYVSSTTAKTKILRVIWGAGYFLFFRPTVSRWSVHQKWRTLVLRFFGTNCWKGIHVSPTATIWAPWNLTTGRSVAIDDSVDLYNVDKIQIGHFVSISRRSFLCTASHDTSDISRSLITSPIRICNGAWIGAQAYIGPGVTVGEGAIVGACSVVTKDVPPWTIVGGNPARVIKERAVDRNEWLDVFNLLESSYKLNW